MGGRRGHPLAASPAGRTVGSMTAQRRSRIIEVLHDAFGDLADRSPRAFQVKYRKMAADPFAFYRGTACLFYADLTGDDARWDDADWVDDRTSRTWIHGDLHPENFGTYPDSRGRLAF